MKKKLAFCMWLASLSAISVWAAPNITAVMADTNGTVRTNPALEGRLRAVETNETALAQLAAYAYSPTNLPPVYTNGSEIAMLRVTSTDTEQFAEYRSSTADFVGDASVGDAVYGTISTYGVDFRTAYADATNSIVGLTTTFGKPALFFGGHPPGVPYSEPWEPAWWYSDEPPGDYYLASKAYVDSAVSGVTNSLTAAFSGSFVTLSPSNGWLNVIVITP